MTFYRPIVVTCDLASPVAGDLPMLDSIVLARWLTLRGGWRRISRREPPPDITRHFEADKFPIAYTRIGNHVIPHASSPIASTVRDDRHHYYHRRFPVDDSVRMCDPSEKSIVTTTMGINKSYRLPLRIRIVERISWIVHGNVREMKSLLKDVHSIARKRGHGWGVLASRRDDDTGDDTGRVRVASWSYREAPELDGAWWYATRNGQPVLMRPIRSGDHLPSGLIGARRDYGACSPPYWHPDRFTEIVSPC